MTETKYTLLKKLDELRELSKKKKYRLAKREHDEVVETISETCSIGLEGIRKSLEALPDFPSDTGAEVVAASWSEISSHLEEFYKMIQGKRYKSELGKRLKLMIGRYLLSKDPEVAMRVIFDVFNDIKPSKKPLPTSKDLHLISMTLLADGASVLDKLQLDSGLQVRSIQLVSYCLAAGFSHGAKGKLLATQQTQLDLIRWANAQQKFLYPNKEIKELITARIREWNDDFLRLLQLELDSLHPSLRVPINGALGKIKEHKGHGDIAAVASPIPGQETRNGEQTETDKDLGQIDEALDDEEKYDPIHELERLTQHVKLMNMELNRSREEVNRFEMKLQQKKNELEQSLREEEQAKKRYSEVKDELEKSLAHSDELEKTVNSLKEQNQNMKSKLIDSEARYREMETYHNIHADELSRRIAEEGDKCLEIFRNKIGRMMKPFAINLNDALSMEMTNELGLAMRNQLKQLLNTIKSQGISIEGDDA